MNREQLTLEIQVIAREVFQKPELVVTDSLSAADVDTWTSLSFTQFIAAIEKQFGFKFKLMELLQMRTMGAIIDATLRHVDKV